MSRIKHILITITKKLATLTALPLVLMLLGAFVTMLIIPRPRGDRAQPGGHRAGRGHEPARKNRLSGVIAGTRFSSDFPAGQVDSANPEPGSRVKAGKNVKLFLSEGRKQVEVPRLVGMTLREAREPCSARWGCESG